MLKNLLAMAKTFTYTSERLYTYLQLIKILFLLYKNKNNLGLNQKKHKKI